ncbi:MAG: ASKHA domain-containing protein [Bacteroidales bacterium]
MTKNEGTRDKSYTIKLEPLHRAFQVPEGTPLIDVLHEYGVEFPCGGKGTCGGCKIRVLEGNIPMDEEHRQALIDLGLSKEWRLACMSYVLEDVTLEVDQWKTIILADNTPFHFTPREGYGIAVDVGTTTLIAQLIDMKEGKVLNAATANNPQSRYGADIMSRVEYAVNQDEQTLTRLIREKVHELIRELITDRHMKIKKIVLVGNTVMHHLFCGFDLTPLATYPFESEKTGLQQFTADSLGWSVGGNPVIMFMPAIGGFIGSDILAGILAARFHEEQEINCLIDLGTNGELVIGNREGMICASTAAGPAFEGTNISMGMTATTGALSSIDIAAEPPEYHIIGNRDPRGICGSGLIDAIAWLHSKGHIDMWGQLTNQQDRMEIIPGIALTQQDIREVQLAKGAISAGARILSQKMAITPENISNIFLAGAFGNYVNLTNAQKIGLIEFDGDKVTKLGNSALIGAKMMLFFDPENLTPILKQITHTSLETDPEFQETYAMKMLFEE